MPYTIKLTDGQTLTTIADGTIDTTTNLTLIGKNYALYGYFLNDNFIKLLENAASITAPAAPLTGQLWYDRTNSQLKLYNGSEFKILASSTAQSTAPTNPLLGDFWFDTVNNQLKVYDGNGYLLIGPAFTTTTGTSGTQVGSIVDTLTVSHVAVNVYVASTLVGIFSKDAEYTPDEIIPGFNTIMPGFNLSTDIPSSVINGEATDSQKLGGILPANYARTDIAENFVNNGGITIGANNNFTTLISSNTVIMQNNISNANVAMRANIGGSLTTTFLLNGSTGLITVAGEPTGNLGIATKSYVDAATGGGTATLLRDGSRSLQGNLLPDTNGSRNLGSSAQRFGNIHANFFIGTSIQSQYADLAERFEADTVYVPGTVLSLGGAKEVTAETEELSENVFGVVSAHAAYLMNSAAGSDETHPAVAVSGRVPVRVIGKIKKGDRLVSAGNGLARAGNRNELTAFNVIGRSLENKTTDSEGTVLAIVKLNS